MLKADRDTLANALEIQGVHCTKVQTAQPSPVQLEVHDFESQTNDTTKRGTSTI